MMLLPFGRFGDSLTPCVRFGDVADGGLPTADVTAACRYLTEVGVLREVVPDRWFALVQD
jgi:hypothetical protein